MKRYKINVSEEVAFNHEITFESDAPDIDKILDKAEKERCLDGVIFTLKEQGCNIKHVVKDKDGSYGEVENDEYEEMGEVE
ncbi:hypothetical protein ACJDU8_17440 [Clostridium sp. WILCCON 0269]|uniref:Phage protein n=1 Tax=Candidatus Clostridium eludens TaxID=3381663 RepID=A0ABW8SMN6_9CLOT